MGTVKEGFIDKDLQRIFIDNHVDSRQGCRDCWARYLCGGGCPYLSVYKKNNAHINDEKECELILHLIRLSLRIYTLVKMKNPGIWDVFFSSEMEHALE